MAINMRVAEIKDGVVVNVSAINRPIADFPGLNLVEVAESVKVGFLYDGSVFTAPAGYAESEAAKASASAAVVAETNELNTLEAKLDAGTITNAELRRVIKIVLRRIKLSRDPN